MDKALKNQVINTLEDTYKKELKNNYISFSGVTFRYLLEHQIYWHRKITTAYLQMKNIRMNELIDSSLPINKYFKWVDNCIKYADNGRTPYTTTQVIQKAHNSVFAPGLYTNAFK